MSEKNIKSRIVHKHDIESNWLLATNFIPKQGELIIYDVDDNYDYERFKIGDGVTVVSSLPFADDNKADVTHIHNSLKDGIINIKAEQNLGGIRIYRNNGSTYGALYLQPASNTYASTESITIENSSNAVSNGAFLKFKGSSSENVRIGGVKTPTNNNEVTNKEYVDTAISAVSTLVGDTSVAEQINTALTSNQSDWNVNDESSASFIKNRTHWVASITNVVFENSSAAFSALDGMYICNESLGFTVSEKSTYLINWDGVDYNCVPHVYSGMTTIGNVSIINGPDETDEPFVIFMSDSDTLCVTSSTATTHSIVVTETSDQVHKIDEKFLPDDIAFKSDIPDMPTVPTKVSELTNDVDYVTLVKGESKNFEFVRDETYSGDHFIYNGFDYYKVSDMAPIYDDVSAVSGTWYANGNISTQNNLVQGTSCYYAGHSIVITEAGACTLSGKTFNAPSIGIYFKKSSDTYYQTALSITCAYKRLSDSVIPDTIARVADIPDAVTIDSTLTNEGQAADAKATGDAISSLNTLVGDTAVSTQISDAITNKVDKVDGKGLSTNDYTTEEKNKLAGIAEGAEVNVQSNWNATEGDALILNKPPITNASSTVTIGDSSTYTIKLSSNAVLMGVENNLGGIRVYKRDKPTYGAFYIRPGDNGNSITILNSQGVLALSSGTSDLSITGVATPTADNGAANKAYVDANKTVVDDALSDTSTNPVQNKVVNTAIANLNTLVGDTSVATQITNAIADKSDVGHTHNYAGADEPGGAANKLTSAYDLSDLGTYPILLAKHFPDDDGTVHKAGNETYTTCGLYHSTGTTTNEGTAMLVLGNSIASGSNKNETGKIKLYNAKGKSFTILPLNGIDVGHTYFLPSEAGTLITEQQTYTRTEVEELIETAKASVMPKIGTIALTTNWTGTASPYYQDVSYSYVTETSMVDLLPTPAQLAQWQEDGLAFTTQSGNGTVRVYVSGGKPTSTIAVQVKIQEVTQL